MSLLAVFGVWLAVVLGACAVAVVIERGILGPVEDWFRRRRDRKRALIEALIRESYLARGEVPKE